MNTTFAAWTYNGRIPAPTLEACEGDKVTINVNNKGTTSHGLDTHAKSGIHGAMIVYPKSEQLRPAREIAVVEDAVYGVRDDKGFIPGTDPAKAQKNEQTFSMFNGRLDNEAVHDNPGDFVRMYFVNVGPGVSSAHVIGTVLDRVYDGKTPIYGVQTYAIPAGSGAMFEFYIPEAGVFPFVDHDKLAFLPWGLASWLNYINLVADELGVGRE